ncbi:S1 family peptidase [Asanoa sp. WMMD1127]|uniref:S1 family peptidase n=1 Tax=Asanoa sp. WMMD1127 TaxID=3016107 RepID=UPI0024168F90|nr:S1 family peptidase [Asanoa sp. WMMD1127]MDG4826922.1 S1 family peptidase [Asanoa sp. WMMD1127]
MRKPLAVAVAAALAIVAGATPAGANDDDPGPRPQRPPVTTPGPLPDKPPAVGPVSKEDLPAGFASWEAMFDEQHRLNDIADRIIAAGGAGGGAGYAGMVVDPTLHDVRLYWKGALPDAVARAVEAGRATAPVRVYQAAYSDEELRAEAARWIASGLVSDAYPKADGSGVTVEVAGAAAVQLPGGARTTYTMRYGQGPVVPLEGEPATASTFYRQQDTSPYWGGAQFRRPGNWVCTTGFAVTDNEGYPGMLTAGHCGTPGEAITTNWGPQNPIGQVWWDWDYQDIALIWIYSDVQGRVYTGPWNSSYGRSINSAKTNYVGNYVCVSGATSGEHCAVKVYYVSPSDVTVKAERTKNGACAAAHGDSGGPVISQSTGAAFGYGIISAGQSSVDTCEPGPFGANDGYHKVHFKGLKFALNHFGATLRTHPYY